MKYVCGGFRPGRYPQAQPENLITADRDIAQYTGIQFLTLYSQLIIPTYYSIEYIVLYICYFAI